MFWNLLKEAPAKIAASIESLYKHFSAYFGLPDGDSLPRAVTDAVQRAHSHVPFSREEVVAALGKMKPGKTCGVALYSVDLFRNARDESLFDLVARLFDCFAVWSYPRALNRMLLLPIYKGRGSRTDPSSYRPISLIHPLGRWYALALNCRLEAATQHSRARS